MGTLRSEKERLQKLGSLTTRRVLKRADNKLPPLGIVHAVLTITADGMPDVHLPGGMEDTHPTESEAIRDAWEAFAGNRGRHIEWQQTHPQDGTSAAGDGSSAPAQQPGHDVGTAGLPNGAGASAAGCVWGAAPAPPQAVSEPIQPPLPVEPQLPALVPDPQHFSPASPALHEAVPSAPAAAGGVANGAEPEAQQQQAPPANPVAALPQPPTAQQAGPASRPARQRPTARHGAQRTAAARPAAAAPAGELARDTQVS